MPATEVKGLVMRNIPYLTNLEELRLKLENWFKCGGLGSPVFEIKGPQYNYSNVYTVVFNEPLSISEKIPLSLPIGNRLATLELCENLSSASSQKQMTKYTFDRKNSKVNVFNQVYLTRLGIVDERQNQVYFGPVPGHISINCVQTFLNQVYWGRITRCICPGTMEHGKPYNVILTYATVFEAILASDYLHCAKPFGHGVTPHARLSRQLKSKRLHKCKEEWVLNRKLGIHIRTKGYVNVNDVPREVLQLPIPPNCSCSTATTIVGFHPDFLHWLASCTHCNLAQDDAFFVQFVNEDSVSPAQELPHENLVHVKDTYDTTEEYLLIYKALLKADKNAQRQVLEKVSERVVVVKWAKVEENIIEVEENDVTAFTSLMYCTLETEMVDYFLEGKLVRVESERSDEFGNKSLWKRRGEIVYSRELPGRNRLIVRFSGLPSESLCCYNVTMHPVFQKTNWTSMKRALKMISKSKYAQYILDPSTTASIESTFSFSELFGFKEPNPSQRDAIVLAMTSEVSIIIGPPGTGKTYVSALTCLLAVIDHRKSADGKGEKVLAVAPSNKAADEIYHKLMERSNCTPIVVVRMYCKSRENRESIEQGIGLHHLVNKSLESNIVCNEIIVNHKKIFYTASMREKIKSIYTEEEGKLLDSADIIVCTCQTAADDRLRENGLKFHTLLIDEAAQSTEPQTLLPMLLASSQDVGRLVLVGDFHQLRACTISVAAKEAGFHSTLMERLHKPERTQTLTQQYRLPSSPCDWTSKTFYNGILGPGHQRRPDLLRLAKYPVNLLYEGNAVWITYHDVYRENKINNSYSNTFEGLIVQEILELLTQAGLPKCKVDILTFYDAQRKFLEDLLSPKYSVKPRNVDSMQGAENDIILISTARSNPNGMIGFLADRRRLNVATSRAKLGMIIIANVNTINKSGNEYWKMLIDSVKAQKSIILAKVNDKSGKLIFEH